MLYDPMQDTSLSFLDKLVIPTCGECEYWDKDYQGVASDIYKPCKHPRRLKKIGSIADTRHSHNHKCEISF